MTDLPKRLEAAGRREAEKLYPCGHDFKVRLSGLSSCGLCLSSLSDNKARRHLHPLVQKMAEALEWYANPCGSCEKNWEFTCHGSPKKARDAIAELEKYLGGV